MVKKLLNQSETISNYYLKDVCEKYGAFVFPKVRLADVFPIENSGISSSLYQYALKSHFDFIITGENLLPLFGVEFDGPLHSDKLHFDRDKKKNALCDKFEFPLLRINSNYLNRKYRDINLLSWMVEVWFYRDMFFEAQEKGHIPWDEPFDPALIARLPEREKLFPLWLSHDIPNKLYKLFVRKKLMEYIPSMFIGKNTEGARFGIMWLQIEKERWIYTKSAIQTQRFPIVETDILSEILYSQLYQEVSKALAGDVKGVLSQEMDETIKTFSQKYEMCCVSGTLHERI